MKTLLLLSLLVCVAGAIPANSKPESYPAAYGDLAELQYYMAQDKLATEWEVSSRAAETINGWRGYMAAVVMARTHLGERIEIICVLQRTGHWQGYITRLGYGRLEQSASTASVVRQAAPWAERAYWLLQGGGRSGLIFSTEVLEE